MKFSVLISLYDKENEKNLQECLQSLYEQLLQPNEIIVVFDGPINLALKNVINKWTSQLPIKVIPIKDNVGLGKALNIGLQECKFELVARMDTDDICHHTRFEKQITYMSENPNIVLLGSNIAEFNEDISDITGVRTVPSLYEHIIKFSRLRSPFNHMSVFFKKSIIQSVGGYKHHLYMEDYNLWLRVISNKYYVENLPDTLVYVRTGNGMIHRRKGWHYIKSEFQLAILKIKLGIQSPFSSLAVCCIRSIPRILPPTLLSLVYKKIIR